MTTLTPWEPISLDRLHCMPTVYQQVGETPVCPGSLGGYTEHSSVITQTWAEVDGLEEGCRC